MRLSNPQNSLQQTCTTIEVHRRKCCPSAGHSSHPAVAPNQCRAFSDLTVCPIHPKPVWLDAPRNYATFGFYGRTCGFDIDVYVYFRIIERTFANN